MKIESIWDKEQLNFNKYFTVTLHLIFIINALYFFSLRNILFPLQKYSTRPTAFKSSKRGAKLSHQLIFSMDPANE